MLYRFLLISLLFSVSSNNTFAQDINSPYYPGVDCDARGWPGANSRWRDLSGDPVLRSAEESCLVDDASVPDMYPFVGFGTRNVSRNGSIVECLYLSNSGEAVGLRNAIQECVYPEDDYRDEDLGDNCNSTQNPCNVSTGNKYRNEVDINSSVLNFSRHYNSMRPINPFSLIGSRWTHNYQRRIARSRLSPLEITFVAESGKTETFKSRTNGNVEQDVNVGIDNKFILETIRGEEQYYKLTHPSGTVEMYYRNGQIASTKDTKGNVILYEYTEFDNFNYLTKISNQYDHSISIEYDVATTVVTGSFGRRITKEFRRISKVTDAFGAIYLYLYDENHNLATVIYPDLTPNNNDDNPRKIYHYENTDFPNHLTGITDENGDRYAVFDYDQFGKVISSELGQTTNNVGQQKIELDYQEGGN